MFRLYDDGAIGATEHAWAIGDDRAPTPSQEIAQSPVNVGSDAARQQV